jgi:hypothetical protein
MRTDASGSYKKVLQHIRTDAFSRIKRCFNTSVRMLLGGIKMFVIRILAGVFGHIKGCACTHIKRCVQLIIHNF